MLANTSILGPVKAGLRRPTYTGHAHFLGRGLSRRTFVRGSALAAALALASPAVVLADSAKKRDPNPIPGGTAFLAPQDPRIFHANFPAFGQEVSTISDFNGLLAAAEIQGGGIGTNLVYDADMRFMRGTYIAVDGHPRQATFGFV
jgi:hypothetical protein